MESEYLKSLDYEARKMYFAKLTNGGAAEKLPDTFGIAEDKWIDDTHKWPQLEFGDIYTYLIDTEGKFTKQV